MKTDTIGMCVVALLLGMLLANMLKNVCGCKVVEGQHFSVGGSYHGSGHSHATVGDGAEFQVRNDFDLKDNTTFRAGGANIDVGGSAYVGDDSELILRADSVPSAHRRRNRHRGGKK